MIKSFSVGPPHTLIIRRRGGRQRALDLKEWIESDALNQTLRQPGVFVRVYKEAGGGAQWLHGPHLDPAVIDEMLELQRQVPRKS